MIARSDFFPALPAREPELRTTRFDHTFAALLAVLACLTLATMLLLAIWLGGVSDALSRRASGGGTAFELLFVEPEVTPIDLEILPPAEDASATDPSIAPVEPEDRALQRILEAATSASAAVSKNPGSDVGPGPTDETDVVIPEPPPVNVRRWVISIDGLRNADDYSTLLNELGIELGAFTRNGEFVYVSVASDLKASVRQPESRQDDRFYSLWQRGSLLELDNELLRRAGVNPGSRPVLHFFSPKTESQLSRLEREAARAARRRVSEIRRTWFTLERTNGRFAFRVSTQQFRDYAR